MCEKITASDRGSRKEIYRDSSGKGVGYMGNTY
jgi:hypothetical protein